MSSSLYKNWKVESETAPHDLDLVVQHKKNVHFFTKKDTVIHVQVVDEDEGL